MSSDTLFHGLRTSHRTESFFFKIGTYIQYIFLFPPHMTGLRLATGWLFPAPFFTGAPWPAVAAPGHWLEHWVFLLIGSLILSFFVTTVAPVLFLFSLFLSRPCLFAVSQ